jgi:outer membrane protein assembly factor BamB
VYYNIGRERMNKDKTATTVALFLMASFIVSLFALPNVSAQIPEKTTYAFIGALPNPAGVGQEVLLHIGITDPLALDTEGWVGLSVTITKPDGTTETISNIRTDSTGGTGKVYVPTMVGNYTLQTHFPEQTYNWSFHPPAFNPMLTGVVKYKASDSEKLTLVVQEEAVPYYPAVPLPTEYWTRPINAQLREWSAISGNWLTTPTDLIAPSNDDAPESAHILWAKVMANAGMVGGNLDSHTYDSGDAYRGKWQSPVIISGVLFYNRWPAGFFGTLGNGGVVAVDLHTGKELWFRNNTVISMGQTMHYSTFNEQGAFAYLWEVQSVFDPATFTFVNNWNAIDPFTGEWMYTLKNVPALGEMFGTAMNIRGPNGEILIYEVDQVNGWMAMWNSTNIPALYGALDPTVGQFGFAYYSWLPEGKTVDARAPCLKSPQTPLGISGYNWNVTIPKGLPGSAVAVLEDRILGSTLSGLAGVAPPTIVFWAISTKAGQEGRLLYNTTWSSPGGDLEIRLGAASVETGVFSLWAKETRAHYGFNLDTGAYLWGPTASQYYLDIYYATINTIAYDKLYSAGAGGICYCYDAKTGKLLWKYEAADPYQEILWANNWWLRPLFVTDGKIYLNHEEHSANDPKPRGAPTVCLNATTGEVIWKIEGAFRGTHWGGRGIIGDSIMTTMDTYDQRIYAIGKGPSATAVTAPDVGVVAGGSMVIQGMVTDISPGTEEYALTARFPNGVPAVSDASMSEWMKYVYLQFARPTDATGVEVTLTAIDPNGNFIELGKTTSDASGSFGFAWVTPNVPGMYKIIATFAGSKSYYPSFAETYAVVAEAPPAPAEPEPAPPSMADTYLLPATAGIIVTIVAVGVVLLLILRRR